MNNQEAIEMIRDDMKKHHDYLSGTYRKALNMAISALEKQIPKIPKYKEEDRFVKNFFAVYTYCPQCGYEINVDDMHCIHCGQRICWEGE